MIYLKSFIIDVYYQSFQRHYLDIDDNIRLLRYSVFF